MSLYLCLHSIKEASAMYAVRHIAIHGSRSGDLEPASIYWCDGSKAEYIHICLMVKSDGHRANKRPNCLFRSDPNDVASRGQDLYRDRQTG